MNEKLSATFGVLEDDVDRALVAEIVLHDRSSAATGLAFEVEKQKVLVYALEVFDEHCVGFEAGWVDFEEVAGHGVVLFLVLLRNLILVRVDETRGVCSVEMQSVRYECNDYKS